jgi:HSP20 family protein
MTLHRWHAHCGLSEAGSDPNQILMKEGNTMAEKAKEKETKAVTPWRPFMDLTRWESDMDRMMEDFFGRRFRPWWPERARGDDLGVKAPTVDVFEEKDDIVVKAELPGMEKENIEVNLTDHMLTIKGEKKKEEEVKEEKYYRSERSYGAFVRTLELPRDVHGDKVKATFKNGVLEIRMPKTEEAKAKEIKVKVD